MSKLIYNIIIVTKPLRRHRYKFGEMTPRPYDTSAFGASGLLMQKIHEQEKIEHDYSENLRSEEEHNLNNAIEKVVEEEKEPPAVSVEKENPKQKKMKRLKKFSIYEDIDEEAIKQAEEIEKKINYDGYYNRIVPSDEGVEERGKKQKLALSPIVLLFIIGIGSIAYLIYALSSIF